MSYNIYLNKSQETKYIGPVFSVLFKGKLVPKQKYDDFEEIYVEATNPSEAKQKASSLVTLPYTEVVDIRYWISWGKIAELMGFDKRKRKQIRNTDSKQPKSLIDNALDYLTESGWID